MALTEQRKQFIEEYLRLRCKNATQAAISAGYSKKTASSQACDILKNPEVSKYLEMRKEQLESELRQEFIFEASEAFKVMQNIMNNEASKDSDRINIAKDFLDRAGFKPKDQVEYSGLDTEKTKLDALINQMRGGNSEQ